MLYCRRIDLKIVPVNWQKHMGCCRVAAPYFNGLNELLKREAIANNYEMENEIKSAASGREYHFYDMIAYGNNPWQKEAMSFVETME